MIEIKHLCKKFNLSTPLRDVNTVINDGEVVSIIGPSGTGKSTLLRCINLLEKPTSGQIIYDGEDITDPKCNAALIRKKIGMVFQSFNLFDHYTVIENVMRPAMEILGKSRQEAYERAMELLHLVGMDGRIMQYPDMLSGGQKQRVAIARALAMDPETLLLDEPTSALDPAMTEEVLSVIKKLTKLGKTVLVVTHEMRLAREVSSKIIYLDKGIVCEEGTPEQIFENPREESTRKFVKRVKVFETRIEARDFDFREKINKITAYGYTNNIDPKIIYSLQSVFEELCGQILVPRIFDPIVLFTAEYRDAENRMSVSVEYNGDKFDPRESENRISLSILENSITNAVHMEADSDVYTNIFTFDLKQVD